MKDFLQPGDLEKLQALRQFKGLPKSFWPEYVQWFKNSIPGVEEAWVILAHGNAGQWQIIAGTLMVKEAIPMQEMASAVQSLASVPPSPCSISAGGSLGALSLAIGDNEPLCALLISWGGSPANLESVLRFLIFTSDVPLAFKRFNEGEAERWKDTPSFDTLKVATKVFEQDQFLPSAMALCNELAKTFGSDMAFLGWHRNGYTRLVAASHLEKIETKMEAARLIEAAMDETFDQDDEITWPSIQDSIRITRDHEQYAATLAHPQLVSLPLRSHGKTIGVLMLQRSGVPYHRKELLSLRLIGDQVGSYLEQLDTTGRPFPHRLWKTTRQSLKGFLGPTHTGAKLLGLFISILLLAGFLIPVPYRVEAPFVVRASSQAFIPAPFSGYLESIEVATGSQVDEGQLLLKLDSTEWTWEAARAQADLDRYQSEALRAESEGEFAAMQVFLAQAEQASAILQLAQIRLESAEVRAPFAGIISEDGDLEEQLGAPVTQGDLLMKIARLEDLYLVLDIDESDISDVAIGRPGVASFASAVGETYPLEIRLLHPTAFPKESGNIFFAEADFTAQPEDWWRPGMTGLAKIEAGRRSFIWIMTHRAIDWLRLFFWI